MIPEDSQQHAVSRGVEIPCERIEGYFEAVVRPVESYCKCENRDLKMARDL
jgi:hypothetical protein